MTTPSNPATDKPTVNMAPTMAPKESRSRGALLSDARAAKGLSVTEVADQLKLTRRIVEALENDDADELPPAIFTRGYLRSYSKLLGLDESKVLEPYEESQQPAKSLSDYQPGMIQSERSPRRRKKSGFWIFLVLLVLTGIVAAFWWLAPESETYDLNTMFNGASSDSANGTLVNTGSEIILSPSLNEPAAEATISGEAASNNSIASDSILSTEIVPPEVSLNSLPPGMDDDSDGATGDNATDVESPPIAPQFNDVSASSVAAADERVSEVLQDDIAVSNDVPHSNITIQGGETASYVTIYNNRRRIVFSKLFNADTSYTFNDAGQYRLLIGKPDDITVQFDGQAYDFSGDIHPRKKTASFEFILE